MAKFKVTVEEETVGLQHRIVIVEAEDEDEAFRLVSEGEGETFDCYDIDTYGPSGNSCDLVSVEECEELK